MALTSFELPSNLRRVNDTPYPFLIVDVATNIGLFVVVLCFYCSYDVMCAYTNLLPTNSSVCTMTPLSLTPLSSLRVSRHQIPTFNRFPNTSLQHRPLLIYHGCFSPPPTPGIIESHLRSTGVVVPQWRYTMYSVSHFHSTTHEVLCVASGRAKLCFGGEENPKKVEAVIEKGDVIVIPAGVAHRLLRDFEGGFLMVGSYPVGTSWDMCYGKAGEEDRVEKINDVGWFERDPIYGDDGPALHV